MTDPLSSGTDRQQTTEDEVFWAIPVDAASEADSVRCVRVEDYERLRDLLGKYPERAQLCHDGHEPIVHFSDCPICVDEDLSLKASRAAPETSDLATAARDLAVLALQGNDYHRGYPDFRDAVDDVLAMTRPQSKASGCPTHGMEHFFEGMCIKCGVVPPVGK